MDTEQDVVAPPRFRRLRIRRLALVLAAAVLIAGGIRWALPARFRLIDEFSLAGYSLHAGERGFLMLTGKHQYEMRDWDGELLYSLQRPEADLKGWSSQQAVESTISPGALSPSGRYVACAVPAGRGARIRVWRDGTPVAEASITFNRMPFDKDGYRFAELRVDDAGRVLYWITPCQSGADPPKPASLIYLIEGGRLVARGELPRGVNLSSDWTTVVKGGTLGELAIAGGRITLLEHAAHPSLRGATPLDGGVAITREGEIYDRSGRLSGRDGGGFKYASWLVTPSRYVAGYQQQRVRLLAPASGDGWTVTLPGECVAADVTGDGRYAVMVYEPDVTIAITNYLGQYPDTDWWLERLSRSYVRLYDRQGRCRARMVSPIKICHIITSGETSGTHSVWEAIPLLSPDGRRLLIMSLDLHGEDSLRVQLYRW